MHLKRVGTAVGLLLMAIALGGYCLGVGADRSAEPAEPAPAQQGLVPANDDQAPAPARRVSDGVEMSLETSMSAAFLPSLEMRENADFVLSPALLVQDWLDRDSVVTYPQE